MAPSHSVDAAGAADTAEVRALLAAARLPVEDPAEPTYLEFPAYVDFLVVRDDAHRVIGAVGLERYGTVGLLRSLVVAPARRNCGIAGALIGSTPNAQFRSLCPASAACMTKLLPETHVSARHD